MKTILKRTGKIFCLFLLIVVLVKCTFTSFLQETGRKICGKSERNRIYIRDRRNGKDLLH